MIDTISKRLGLDPDWRERGACRTAADVNFYPDKTQHAKREAAKRVCLSCPALDACRAWQMAFEYGLGREMRWGVIAAMTGRERYELERSIDRQSQDAEAAA